MRRTLFFSLVLHAVLLAVLWKSKPAQHAQKHSPPPALQTRVLSEKAFAKEFQRESKRAQIVQADDQLKSTVPPEANKEAYLARHHQRFDQNTRAARVGEFKNVLKEGTRDASDLFKLAPEDATPKTAEAAPKTPTREPAAVEENTSGKTTRFPASHQAQTGPVGDGQSATDDYLPHVAIGANTLLNTREYKYASFFERIREKLNHQWQRRLRSEMESLYLQGVDGFQGERMTKLRVTLDSRGEVVRIMKEGSAGYIEFDRAAIGAFHAASPFPNPPKDLLEGSEANISIDWHFVVMGAENSGFRVRVDRAPAGF